MITDPKELPEPGCRSGYPVSQLKEVLDEQQYNRLMIWMRGQTMMLCQGRAYSHERQEYYEVCNGVSHGPVIYSHDLYRFIEAKPIID